MSDLFSEIPPFLIGKFFTYILNNELSSDSVFCCLFSGLCYVVLLKLLKFTLTEIPLMKRYMYESCMNYSGPREGTEGDRRGQREEEDD